MTSVAEGRDGARSGEEGSAGDLPDLVAGRRNLYFCSAPRTWTAARSPSEYGQVRYDLRRVPYDANQGVWGEAEMVLAAADTGKSILLPRISPDGRWLLFSMCDYGCFPVYQQEQRPLSDGSPGRPQTGLRPPIENQQRRAEWHSWSSNSRWIAFSSKRDSGLFTRTYLSYVDDQGQVHKPVLLPQEDPAFYDSCLWTFSVPELVTQPVTTRKEALGRVVRGSEIDVKMPITMATPKVETTPQSGTPYLSGRE